MRLRNVFLAAVLSGTAALTLQTAADAGQPAAPAAPVHPADLPKGHYAPLDKLPDWGGVWIVAQQRRQPGAPPPEQPQPKGKYLEQYNKMKVIADAQHGEWPSLAPSVCTPRGFPYIMSLGQYPTEILFNPGRVTMLHEERTGQRRIYTDGRGHAPPEDADATYFGDSIGHWEGDTLVVETIDLKPSNQIANGVFHSDKMKVLERIHLDPEDKAGNTLLDEMTVIDDEALAQPYHQTIRYRRHRDLEILEFVCAENDRNDFDANGKQSFQ